MTDAGPTDTGMPTDSPPAVCANATECDDGTFCNGPETCSPGATGADAMGCVPGTDPCSGGACSEMANTCSSCGTADADGDGVDAVACGGTDCDDDDAARYPGATEICDGDDEDCNDTTFGDRDTDVDGAIDVMCCNGTTCGPDCDDGNASVGPTGTETCNGLDDNCDGAADEGVLVMVYVDADRDGHGNAAMSSMSCAGVAGYSAYGDDCDDTTPLRSPSLPELCDALDNDCDAATAAVGTATVPWYRDSDGDGFGDPAVTVTACTPPAMHVLLGTDCADADAMVHPAAAERCNAQDDNCDGFANYVVTPGNFEDDDHDGYFDSMCVGGDDCNDRNPTIHPGGTAFEVCNGLDDDCNGMIDEGTGMWSYYVDADGDGYGTGTAIRTTRCSALVGQSAYPGDCDDFDSAVSPGAPELCNGYDDNCDTNTDEDPAAGGSCARVGSIMACVSASCAIIACTGISQDCNGTVADGCEANVFADPRNCGACGTACAAGGTCDAGVCNNPVVVDLAVGSQTLCLTVSTGGVSCQGFWSSPDGLSMAGASTTQFESVTGIDDAVATVISPGPVFDGATGSVGMFPHFCALRTGGRVSCWGRNAEGQLGDGTMVGRAMAAEVTGITDATQVVVGQGFSCALRMAGGVVCWGANNLGQLGNGTTTARTTPMSIPGLTGVTSLSAHKDYACAVRTGGAVSCWGSNVGDAFVTAGMASYTSPTAVTAFAAGTADVLAVDGLPCRRTSAGGIECRAGSCLGPAGPAVSGFTTPVQIAGSGGYLCERESGGTVRCTTRVICGATGNVLSPIVGLDNVAQIGASDYSGATGTRACARLINGEIWCWSTYDAHPRRAPNFPVCSGGGVGTEPPIFMGAACDTDTGTCITACLSGPASYRNCISSCTAGDTTPVDCWDCVVPLGVFGPTLGCGSPWSGLDCCTRQLCPTGASSCVATNCPRELSILDACLDVDPTQLTRCYR